MLLSSILSHPKTISFEDLKIELPMMSLPCCYFVAFRILLSCCAVFKERRAMDGAKFNFAMDGFGGKISLTFLFLLINL
jgi:hypothetical protein